MSLIFDKKQALTDWTNVRSLSDVYAWHLKHTPFLGKQVINDLMPQYTRMMMDLEKGMLDESKHMMISEFQKKLIDSVSIKDPNEEPASVERKMSAQSETDMILDMIKKHGENNDECEENKIN